MSNQPEALRLAAVLEDDESARLHLLPYVATELRRLHALNGELLEALKYHQEQTRPIERTRAAIARAEGQT